ncbi:hypothetical protein AAE02nite_32240 [Adhaeribacter aerolatus]|uniref:Tetratricopeptide repeat protein n=1 Tax=Adhaeribacter aerolatus TaxID=670289 RepID=A0A512B0S0_9BACT|nr:tetratricopeptide repeat protein [Adhaeribacter aerolatus]GEO05560.1 hypothetical protein AAE02nite_32240 [Adhaeribacter aerolatus]
MEQEFITSFLVKNLHGLKEIFANAQKLNFKQRIYEFESLISKVTIFENFPNLQKPSSPQHQHVCNQYTFAAVALFINDVHGFNQRIDSTSEKSSLEEIKTDSYKIKYLIRKVNEKFNPTEKALEASKIINNTLDDVINRVESKIAQILQNELGREVNYQSQQLFNIGFYILNSKNLFGIPKQTVLDGYFNFKNEFFPTFETIKWEDYIVSKKLFELALKIDPNNVLAEIYKEVAYLFADMYDEYACFDRKSVIENLVAILSKYPNHALCHIELANAYSSVGESESAKKHIDLALRIDSDSPYLLFKALMIYQGLYDEGNTKTILSRIDAYQTNNPWLFYVKAIDSLKNNKNFMAFQDIDNANKYGKSKDFLWLRQEIFHKLKKSLSDKEYESLGCQSQIIKDELKINELESRENKFKIEYCDFNEFSSLIFSEDFTSVEIMQRNFFIPQKYYLIENKNSIVLLDFNTTLYDISSFDVFSTSIFISGGKYFFEEETVTDAGCLYIKDLQFEQLLSKNYAT